MTVGDPHISAEKQGVLGLLTLKRPAALNALNTGMVVSLADAIDAWVADEAVQVIAIRGEGARAFCAGGDIRAWVSEGADAGLAFLRAEYRLNHKIATCPKPFLALMHGVTMGGGAGLSVHARHRIADPGLVFAMPEAAIGFVPDIGSTYFLPRCPGEIGMYLGLTAGRIGLGDVMAAGLADLAVPAEHFDTILEKIAAGGSVTRALAGLTVKPPPAALAPERQRLASLFGGASVEAILERLARDGSAFAREAADAIRANSPTSLKLAFHLLRRGASLSLEACLRQEYHAATHLLRRPDIREGVRAAIIDKDRAPRWQPSALAAIGDGDIALMLAKEAGSPEFE
jgi:enoyl-CoA hydratase